MALSGGVRFDQVAGRGLLALSIVLTSAVGIDQATAGPVGAAPPDERRELMAERTSYTRVFAEPDGNLTYESTVVPTSVRRTDGSWTDVDLDLVRDSTGVHPKASVADVRFSTGDDDDAMATVTRGGKRLVLDWTGGDLPEPELNGDTATYREVLPGVDLALRATHLGFSHVFVVKTAEAAKSAKVREIGFDVSGDARLRSAWGSQSLLDL